MTAFYLTDLTFVEEGTSQKIRKSNLINFAKHSKTARIIREIQRYQKRPYEIQALPKLQSYILSELASVADDHETANNVLEPETGLESKDDKR